MSGNQIQLFSRQRGRRVQSAMTATQWRDTMRDIGDMLSGIYQDLRGDLAGAFSERKRSMRWSLRKSGTRRNS